ncbi:ABC transporter ATP-binding protein [Candidatus Formimonas warabiya]|uniref:Branched-chain amino acid ABC transporter ATP-binding protein n=1 Tax=Formimonas warabiya TaxID=1761012 RepID=A0A3G1KNQ4_FORW1|nr:ABC transporter ATP-binding protein [Candidatus Formimonas warabiya]ATW23745.1 branched-chain amino acid ABC transporter ATP-binding protein [Candidatus Formimonas warabiya]
MLKLSNINAGYGKLGVLWNVSLEVNEGEFVALLGPNGVGKTTALRTISGIVTPAQGEVWFMGKKINGLPVQKITRMGISYVTDDGCLFSGMTVMENLMLGAYTIKDKKKVKASLEKVFALFPRLAERKKQFAGSMSGGERKMLAIARGLMPDPKLMLVDEPSLGLAPKLVLDVFKTLKELTTMGVTVLLVEQNVNTTLKIVDRGYVLEQGSIVQEGSSQELRENDHIKKTYLGIA